MRRESQIWLLAILTFGVGDLVTTAVGLETGLVEQAPLYSDFHAALPAVAFAMKLIVFGVALVAYRVSPKPENIGIPTGLAILGTAVTLWNSYLILSVV